MVCWLVLRFLLFGSPESKLWGGRGIRRNFAGIDVGCFDCG